MSVVCARVCVWADEKRDIVVVPYLTAKDVRVETAIQ